jgi:glutamine amidotransferase
VSASVVVYDYGSGNVHSAVKALERAGAEVQLTHDRAVALEAKGLVVPGVGAYATVMQALEAAGGREVIDKRIAGGRDVLGICVGLQIMFDYGLEHDVSTPGLGQWPGTVVSLEAEILPHMGWNTVEVAAGSTLFSGVEEERFYFVHSYAVVDWELTDTGSLPQPLVSYSTYGSRFVAAVENGPLSATQFHPEKSGPAGLALLKNWVDALA